MSGITMPNPIPSYDQAAGEADKLPFKTATFDRAFVSFSLHHFGNPAGVVGEVLRVFKNGGRFVVVDPIIEESKDAIDVRWRPRSTKSSAAPMATIFASRRSAASNAC